MQTTAGLPWWGTLACAVVAILVGYAVDSSRGDVLTMFFTVMYFVGCVLAVLLVRNKSLFTAMAQPPLLLVIAVPLAYKSFAAGPSNGLRSLVFDMGLPLVDRFPTMIVTTAVVWIIGALRIALYVRERRGAAGRPRKATAATRPPPAPRRRAAPTATAATTQRADAETGAGRRTSRHRNTPMA
ncbi:MAG: hypothetical protein L0H59_15020, partial [Tomitella sp.]|nr:hypothetical protein [Tomitella sp.]